MNYHRLPQDAAPTAKPMPAIMMHAIRTLFALFLLAMAPEVAPLLEKMVDPSTILPVEKVREEIDGLMESRLQELSPERVKELMLQQAESEERYREVVARLKRLLDVERRNLRAVRAAHAKDLSSRTELETLRAVSKLRSSSSKASRRSSSIKVLQLQDERRRGAACPPATSCLLSAPYACRGRHTARSASKKWQEGMQHHGGAHPAAAEP